MLSVMVSEIEHAGVSGQIKFFKEFLAGYYRVKYNENDIISLGSRAMFYFHQFVSTGAYHHMSDENKEKMLSFKL